MGRDPWRGVWRRHHGMRGRAAHAPNGEHVPGDDALLREMCGAIITNKSIGLYDGAYKAVEIAMGLKKNPLTREQ